ncbi:MAG: ADOP family duplicated permease [Gemmatimonas sp.]
MKIARFLRLGRARGDAEIGEEIDAHLTMAIAERLARGESPRDAETNARREFGNVGHIQEVAREMSGTLWLERLAQDARFGLRMLRRAPGFSIVAILCLTLGIGANAVVAGWTEGILFRPYPGVANQDRLVHVAGTANGEPGYVGLSFPDFTDLERASTQFDAFVVSKITGATISNGDRAERVTGLMVSPNYFQALGVRPMLGRGFVPEEGTGRNAHPVTVISYTEWKDRFRGDPSIIGKTQQYNGVTHVIVGVAPRGFIGTFVGYSMQFYVPTSMQAAFDPSGYKLEDRGARWIEGFALLKRGTTLDRAQSEISATAARLASDYPDQDRGHGVRLLPLWRGTFDGAQNLMPTLRIGLAVALFVLLIACANVANLLLVRSFVRRHEITVRLSLGAGRLRLIRQLFTEALLLSAIATGCAALLAYWLRDALTLFFPSQGGVTYTFRGDFDWRVCVLSATIGIASVIVFAAVPALHSSRADLSAALKSDSRSASGPRDRSSLRAALVVFQVALSFVLLVAAGLVLRSLQSISAANPGFSTDGVLSTYINLFAAGYDTTRAKTLEDRLLQRISSIGGVDTVALARSVPFSTRPYDSGPIAVDGFVPKADEQPAASYNSVSPGYFATLGIDLVSGRDFTTADNETSEPVAIVGETMVGQFWRGENPIGKRLQVGGRWRRIVGVAKNVKFESLLDEPRALFYLPLRQNFATAGAIFIRTRKSPDALSPILAREIHALDPRLAPYEVFTMREQVRRATSSQRIAVTLLAMFGVLAMFLAGIGLYGTMAYAVSQRRRELGLRTALGAAPSKLLGLVLSQGLRLTAIGIFLGGLVAFASTRLIAYMLYQVSPRDPDAFVAALVVMMLAALLACFAPAWRAARTDPVTALR